MNKRPSQIPQFFPIQTFLGIDKSHLEIGDRNYLNIKESSFCSENDSYKIFEQKSHILLNHFLQKISNVNSATVSLLSFGE